MSYGSQDTHGPDPASSRRPPAGERPLLPGLASTDELAADRQFAQTLARGLDVLRAFTPADASLGNNDLTRRTGLPKATVSRLTYTLMLLGYLTPVEGRFRLAAGVLALGYPLLASLQVRQVARPFIEEFGRVHGCTVNLGARDRLTAIYLDTCRVDDTNLNKPDIGSAVPLLSTSIGRVLLATVPARKREAILNRLRIENPEATRRELPGFLAEEEHFAGSGFCRGWGAWRPDIHAVAVPLRQLGDAEGLALNATLTVSRLKDGRFDETLGLRLLETAARIEQACGLK